MGLKARDSQEAQAQPPVEKPSLNGSNSRVRIFFFVFVASFVCQKKSLINTLFKRVLWPPKEPLVAMYGGHGTSYRPKQPVARPIQHSSHP